jgi:hypothetical protein
MEREYDLIIDGKFINVFTETQLKEKYKHLLCEKTNDDFFTVKLSLEDFLKIDFYADSHVCSGWAYYENDSHIEIEFLNKYEKRGDIHIDLFDPYIFEEDEDAKYCIFLNKSTNKKVEFVESKIENKIEYFYFNIINSDENVKGDFDWVKCNIDFLKK